MTLSIHEEAWRRFKSYCAMRGQSMSEIIERLINEELMANQPKMVWGRT